MIPRIRQADGQIGFYWVSGDGRPVTLAERLTGLETELRAGQIVGTSALLAIRARMALGTDGPGPFAGMLSEPRAGLHGSGVEKDGALDEHRAALLAVSASADADAGAIEWLLYDWLMAHRESERGAAIEIRFGRPADAAMIVAAAAVSSARARARERSLDFQRLGRHS